MELDSYLGSETTELILNLYNSVQDLSESQKRSSIVRVPVIQDRALRTKVHKAIRRIFRGKLETFTDARDTITVSAMPSGPGGARSTESRNFVSASAESTTWRRPMWEELGGDHLHFTVYKENKDTMEVVSSLARQLSLQSRTFQFAGTKDRRGITVQRVSAYRVLAKRLAGLSSNLRGSKLGDFAYQRKGLDLGELTGNEFVITLRDCSFPTTDDPRPTTDLLPATEVMKEAIENLSTKGFINYYGLQRFGAFSSRTDIVGLKMLKGEFQSACEHILSYNAKVLAPKDDSLPHNRIASDDRARAAAIQLFKATGDSHAALNRLPRKFSAETALIRYLGTPERSNDYLGALRSIPRNLRTMYSHAYQSLIWNLVAGERWRLFGNQVIEGDLVLVEKNEHVSEEVGPDGGADDMFRGQGRHSQGHDQFQRARPLSKMEAESGKWTIFDIVLPTPGFDVEYPTNSVGKFYETVMASDRGGGLDPNEMRRKWRELSLSGSYRKLLGRPLMTTTIDNTATTTATATATISGEGGGDGAFGSGVTDPVHFQIKLYHREDEALVETDLDRLLKSNTITATTTTTTTTNNTDHHPQMIATTTSEGGKDDDLISLVGGNGGNNGVVNDTAGEGSGDGDGDTDAGNNHDDKGNQVQSASPPAKLAVIIKFQLASSQYATMALRELLGPGGLVVYKPDYSGGR